MVFSYFNSQPRTKQKYVSYENEGLSGMLKLCTAVMRHDPSFKMSPAGLVSDIVCWDSFAKSQCVTLSMTPSNDARDGKNGPFALTGHTVQNPPYWMAKSVASSTGTSKTKECQA